MPSRNIDIEVPPLSVQRAQGKIAARVVVERLDTGQLVYVRDYLGERLPKRLVATEFITVHPSLEVPDNAGESICVYSEDHTCESVFSYKGELVKMFVRIL